MRGEAITLPSFKGLKYIRGLHECNIDMVPQVGGKNASLGELIRAGFNVPIGFAITTDAYRRFAQEFDLQGRIKERLSSIQVNNLEQVSREVRGLMESYPLPQDVEEEIETAYDAFVHYLQGSGEVAPAVAVRSSATVEDLRSASFAGQFDTFLAIKTRESLVAAVRKCWSSLFTARAIAYRNSKGIPHENSLMSVGIQKMVGAKAAGVIFTLDPITGNRASVVLNANWGLGASVVEGVASVDSFIVNKVTLDIIKREIATKELQDIVNCERGEVVRVKVPLEMRGAPCLTEDEIKELARQAKLIEHHYSRPQDIEFAVAKCLDYPANIFITQSRPETKWSAQVKPITKPKGHIAEHLVNWFRG
jgi:pyruvate,water dikinase